MLWNTFVYGSHQGRPTNVADLGAVFDEFDFLSGLDHAQFHAVSCDVGELHIGEHRLYFFHAFKWHVVKFQTNASLIRNFLCDRAEVVPALPVGVNHGAITNAFAPRLAAVNICRNDDTLVLCNDQAVKAAKRAVEKIAVIVDVVVASKHNGIY